MLIKKLIQCASVFATVVYAQQGTTSCANNYIRDALLIVISTY